MVERSGYSVYFSDDLRSRVSKWADNSTSSQADIIDKALEDFFDRHEISDDGTIVSEQQNSGMDASNDDEQQELLEQIVENQEEMMRSLHSTPEKNGADIFSDERDESSDESGERVPAKVEASDVEMQIKELAGDYQHDDCIDPDELATISISTSDVVKQTPEYLIPVVVAVLNDKPGDWVGKDDVENIIVNDLGMSMSTARNYRDQMIQQGVLRPHPSVDDKFVGEERLKKVQLRAVKESTDRVHEYADINNTKRLPGDVGDFICNYVSGWGTDVPYLDEYCVDDDAYVEELWRLVTEAAESMAPKRGGDNKKQVGISKNERLAGAVMVTSQIAAHLGNVSGCDMGYVNQLVVESNQCDEPDQYREWMVKWSEERQDVEEELFSIDHEGESISEEEARDVLGVDGGASDGEISEAYRDYVMSNHPDADGGDSDMDVGEYQDVLEARRVLTG